ncbi:hypothetical protein CBS101457_005057 [Exobasidium rhododendri]|nr:hypothetical protein CBS101457_005057 [Exobasidium rhododendri]
MSVFGAQPALNTRTSSRLRDIVLCRSFTWINPAPIGAASATQEDDSSAEGIEKDTPFAPKPFDSSQLPVPLAEKESTKKTAGLWFLNPKEPATALPITKMRKSAVVLYFHGGAYKFLEAGDIFMGLTLGRMKAKYANIDVLSVNYRLAPGSKYPSQLFEAYSAWIHLRKLGYSNILLGGDSAGANLALTLWRYLHEVADTSSTVPGLILHSPWIDLDDHKRESFVRQKPHCVLTTSFTVEGVKAMQTGNAPSPQDPWLSPLFWPATTIAALPPLFISNGGEETIFEESCEFVEKAKAGGVKVVHVVVDGHPHDFAAMFWYTPSIKRLFSKVGAWVETVAPSGEA